MRIREDLIGKTITGVVAAPTAGEGPTRIWMLQFSDGTHVEFVSPAGRRRLERAANESLGGRSRAVESPQMTLNVA